MWPYIIGAGLVTLIASAFDEEKEEAVQPKKIFISFAIEDSKYRDFLVAQARNERTPFSFVDMSVKQPWEEKVWQQKCRAKIKQCDGMIVLLSKNTWHSGGTRWEIKCAREEKVSVIGMHIKKGDMGAKPPELNGKKVITWSWDNLEDAINKF